MVVKHNISAMNSNRMLGITQGSLSKSTEKLSSGYKINRAADNAAGLAISEKMRKQCRGLTRASANAEDGISAVQTAEGALTEVHDMLQRMNELAVQAANGTNSESDRAYIQDEIDQLSQEIDRVAETTKFNEAYLLKGDTKNKDAMGYTFSYMPGYVLPDGTVTVTFPNTENISMGLHIKKGKLQATDNASDLDNLSKIFRDQGVTISTATVSGEAVYVFELNGSDAKTDYDVHTINAKDGIFEVTNKSGEMVAHIELGGKEKAKIGSSQIITAISVREYPIGRNPLALYDRNGNYIPENKLSDYFHAEGGSPGEAATAVYADSGKKVYDALGYELSASRLMEWGVDLITAVKDKTAALKMSFHVGADGTANNKISINLEAMDSKSLGINGIKVNGRDGSKATAAIDTISAAIRKVSTQRSALGAVQNRLEHTINNLDNIIENTTSAESAIRDTDMAEEMVNYSNGNILVQAGQSMLAQSNQANQGVLSLLG